MFCLMQARRLPKELLTAVVRANFEVGHPAACENGTPICSRSGVTLASAFHTTRPEMSRPKGCCSMLPGAGVPGIDGAAVPLDAR